MKNFNLSKELIIALETMNITEPTEIQKQSIPVAMSGADILASSQTGSGKTLAYLLPLIDAFIKNKTTALILVPTRELATQIHSTLNKVTTAYKMNSAVLIGGEPMFKQFMQLKKIRKLLSVHQGVLSST
ncbi:Cold shock-like protein CspA [Rickettsia prowazekii str. GvF12]|nr:Cold shock-like protein CspA [Rickettsia prowazekii str. GvF12]